MGYTIMAVFCGLICAFFLLSIASVTVIVVWDDCLSAFFLFCWLCGCFFFSFCLLVVTDVKVVYDYCFSAKEMVR